MIQQIENKGKVFRADLASSLQTVGAILSYPAMYFDYQLIQNVPNGNLHPLLYLTPLINIGASWYLWSRSDANETKADQLRNGTYQQKSLLRRIWWPL